MRARWILAALALASILAAGAITRVIRPKVRSGSLAGANVLLITIDTLRADRLGVYGSTAGLTPTLDHLAQNGVRFDAAFSHVPITLAAHSSILTGLFPPAHGVHNNGSFRLPDEVPRLATVLKEAGYRTGAFVGAFVLDARFGLNRGFDVYDDSYPQDRDAIRFSFSERRADHVIRPAIEWITRAGDVDRRNARPWLAWIHLFDPHGPYSAPPPYSVGRAPYDAEVAYTDASLAPLLDAIASLPESTRTIIVVTADHGESLGEHGETTHGLFAYESTLRVPLIVSAPGVAARVIQRPVSHVDILPTILDLIGAPCPRQLDGRSRLEALAGHEPDAHAIYFEALDASLTRGWAPLTGVIAEGWKYIDLPVPELYDLAGDPGETRNRATEDPRRLARLRSALIAIRERARAHRPDSASTRSVDPSSAAHLRALGYAASRPAMLKSSFTDADDPKNLVHLNETFNVALEDYNAGRIPEAVAGMRHLLSARSDFLTARTTLSAMLLAAGEGKEAVHLLEAAPDAPPALLLKLGEALQAIGRDRQAVTALERAAEGGDGDPDLLNALGVAYSRVGRLDEARRMLERLLSLDPDSTGTWNNLGLVEMQSGDSPAAAAAFERAVATDPGYADAWEGLGAALVKSDPSRAADAWQHAVALSPRNYDLLFNLGMVLSEGPAPAAALPYLRRFVAEAPVDRYAADVPHVRSRIAAIERRGSR